MKFCLGDCPQEGVRDQIQESQSIKKILESKPVDTYSIIGFHNHEEGLIIKACTPEKTCIIYLIVNGILRDQKEFSFESF